MDVGKYGVAKVVWPVVENAVKMVDTCAWMVRGVSGKFGGRGGRGGERGDS